jgi:hypothetical protein
MNAGRGLNQFCPQIAVTYVISEPY